MIRPKKSRPRACTVCRHPERQRIEALHTAGVSLDRLAEKFSVHRDAIWRHCREHISEQTRVGYLIGPARIAELGEIAAEESESILDYLVILRSAIFGMLDQRAIAGDHVAVATLSGRATDVLREIGRLTGQISALTSSTIINVTHNTAILNSAPFAELQSGLLEVCARHPEARQDIVALFRQLDAKHAPRPPQAQHGGNGKLIEAAAHG